MLPHCGFETSSAFFFSRHGLMATRPVWLSICCCANYCVLARVARTRQKAGCTCLFAHRRSRGPDHLSA
jgi:hypothetical protein